MSIKRYRLFFGLTQKELANLLDMKLSTYRAKEQGKSSFSDTEKKKVRDLFSRDKPGITIDEIFFASEVQKKY